MLKKFALFALCTIAFASGANAQSRLSPEQERSLAGITRSALGPPPPGFVDATVTPSPSTPPHGRTDCRLIKSANVYGSNGRVIGTAQRWGCPHRD